MKNILYSRDEIYAIVFIIITAITLPIVLFVDLAAQRSSPAQNLTIEERAWAACVLWVERGPKVPASEAQEYAPGRVSFFYEPRYPGQPLLPRYVIDVYYPNRRDAYHCDLRLRADGWYPISISIIHNQNSFCIQCGFSANADYVAALNIRVRATVNSPMVPAFGLGTMPRLLAAG